MATCSTAPRRATLVAHGLLLATLVAVLWLETPVAAPLLEATLVGRQVLDRSVQR